MSETKKSNGCLVWTIIGVIVLIVALAGTWYFLNDGFRGTLAGTIAKLQSKTPEENPDLQPNLRPNVPPQTAQPDLTQGQQPEPATPDIKSPIFGLPGLGLGNPLAPQAPPATGTQTQPDTSSPAAGQQPLASLGNTGDELTPPSLQSPSDVLKACVELLKTYDLVGAEKYVSPNGLSFTMGTTVGVHEILWKGLYQVQAYQSIGYDSMKVSGQTALVPLYSSMGNRKVAVAYVVMAHRGDGWKLDHITDPSRF